MNSRYARAKRGRRGFTLLEILAATAIFTVLIGAMSTLFNSALRMRERTFEAVEAGLPNAYVVRLLRRDLQSMAPPVGLLAGALLGETEEEGGVRLDTLEFFTASGVVEEDTRWGDLQKIEYYLEAPEEESGPNTPGQDFVRAITRNLLAAVVEEPEEQRLLRGVQSLELTYYDGEDWQDSWDSTALDNETPLAVKARIEFVQSETPGEGPRRPIELICEIVSRPRSSGEEQGA